MRTPLKFVKKPVVIDAIEWTGQNLREVIKFTDGLPDTKCSHAGMKWEEYEDLVARDGLKIFTLEGKMNASVGDWIIKGVKGEFYPCKPDIFAATYAPVERLDQGLPLTRAQPPTLAEALALPEVRGLVEAAILDAQIRAFERRKLDTPEEIKAAANARALAAQERGE